jgi:hypothetical protein
VAGVEDSQAVALEAGVEVPFNRYDSIIYIIFSWIIEYEYWR